MSRSLKSPGNDTMLKRVVILCELDPTVSFIQAGDLQDFVDLAETGVVYINNMPLGAVIEFYRDMIVQV